MSNPMLENWWAPAFCPITGLKLFMWIEHPEDGWVPTYGGPYDSYTIPARDDNGCFIRERFDHDEGAWLVGDFEDVGVQIVSDQFFVSEDESEIESKASFLVKRLRDFEPDNITHENARDWMGHVVPALERLENFLDSSNKT